MGVRVGVAAWRHARLLCYRDLPCTARWACQPCFVPCKRMQIELGTRTLQYERIGNSRGLEPGADGRLTWRPFYQAYCRGDIVLRDSVRGSVLLRKTTWGKGTGRGWPAWCCAAVAAGALDESPCFHACSWGCRMWSTSGCRTSTTSARTSRCSASPALPRLCHAGRFGAAGSSRPALRVQPRGRPARFCCPKLAWLAGSRLRTPFG